MAKDSDTLSNLMAEIDAFTKLAEIKAAEGDPPTTHPVGDADDNAQPAETGEHAATVEQDTKTNVGEAGVNSTPEVGNVGQPSSNVGTDVVGPASPPPDGQPGGHPDEPGTTHPASGDSGEKYSSLQTPDDVISACNSVLEQLAKVSSVSTPAATPTPAKSAEEEGDKKKEEEEEEKGGDGESEKTEKGEGSEEPKEAALHELSQEEALAVGILQKQAELAATQYCDMLQGFVKGAEEMADPSAAPAGSQEADADLREQALAAIADIMQQAGITPEELMMALSGAGGSEADAAAAEEAAAAEAAAAAAGASSEGEKMGSVAKPSNDEMLAAVKAIKTLAGVSSADGK